MQKTKIKAAAVLRGSILGLCLVLAGCTDSAEDIVRRAVELEQGGQYRAALSEYRSVLQRDPEHERARLGVGENNLYLGEYERAEQALEEAARGGIGAERTQPLLAAALLGQGDYKGVLKRIQPEAVSDPSLIARLYAARANAHRALDELDKAGQAVSRALDARADEPHALTAAGRLALSRGEDDKARRYIARVLDGDERLAAALLARGRLALKAGDTDAAIDYLAEAVQRPPTDVSVSLRQRYAARGQQVELLVSQDRLDAAKDVLDVMLKQSSNHPYANYLAGVIAYRDERLDDAVEHLQITLSASGDSTRAKAVMGAALVERGEYERAVGLLQEVVSDQPDNLRARLRLVAALREVGNNEQAVRVLTEGVKRAGSDQRALTALVDSAGEDIDRIVADFVSDVGDDPSARESGRSLVQALIDHGSYEPAVSLLQNLNLNDSDSELLRRQYQAVAALKAGKLEAATAEANELVAAYPENASSYSLLGGVHLAAENLDKAREAFQRASDLDPKLAQPHFNMALVAANRGDFDRAATQFERGLELSSNEDVGKILRLVEIHRRAGNTSEAIDWAKRATEAAPDDPRPWVRLAQLRLAVGESEEALDASQKAVDVAPDEAAVHRARGKVLQQTGENTKALASFERAQELAPNNPDLQLELARAQAASGAIEQARQTLSALVEAHPDYLRGYRAQVRLALEAGDYESALASADQMRKREEGRAAGALLAGRIHRRSGDLAAAATAYREAITHGRPEALKPLTSLRVEMNRPKPAQPFEEWLEEHPNAQEARLELAAWYMKRGQHQNARRHYKTLAEQTNRQNAAILNNLAWLYAETGDEKALETAREAHQIAPDSAAVQDTLGWIYLQQGRVSKAIELLSQAAEAGAESAEIQYHYGAALAQAGQEERAQRVLERALELNDQAAWSDDANALLSRIEG